MLISKFIDVLKGLENNSIMAGFGYLEIVQQGLDDIYSDDMIARLLLPAPFATTAAATLEYTFEAIFPAFVASGVTTIRRVRGLWDPSLSPEGSATVTDFGRSPVAFFDQRDINRRVYDGDAYVDNERKTVTFKSDPGTSTTKRRVDMYLNAPIVTTSSQIPLLLGWERKLLLPACRSWFEELDEGRPGIQAALFEKKKEEYRSALEREFEKPNNTEDLGVDIDFVVKPL